MPEDEETDEIGTDVAKQGGNGAWKPFDSESGKEAALVRIQYQRELKRQAREAMVEKQVALVRDTVDLQENMIRQALSYEAVEKEVLDTQKAGLAAGEKMLDRLFGRPTSKTQIEDVSSEETEADILDAEWELESDDSTGSPEAEGE